MEDAGAPRLGVPLAAAQRPAGLFAEEPHGAPTAPTAPSRRYLPGQQLPAVVPVLGGQQRQQRLAGDVPARRGQQQRWRRRRRMGMGGSPAEPEQPRGGRRHRPAPGGLRRPQQRRRPLGCGARQHPAWPGAATAPLRSQPPPSASPAEASPGAAPLRRRPRGAGRAGQGREGQGMAGGSRPLRAALGVSGLGGEAEEGQGAEPPPLHGEGTAPAARPVPRGGSGLSPSGEPSPPRHGALRFFSSCPHLYCGDSLPWLARRLCSQGGADGEGRGPCSPHSVPRAAPQQG